MAGKYRVVAVLMAVFGALVALAGSGCTLVDPQLKAEVDTVAPQPPGTRRLPLRFVQLEGRLRHGAEIGRYTWGLLCKPPYRIITWETGRRLIANHEYSDIFYEAMTRQGFDVAGDPAKMFDREDDEGRAELLVSAQVDEIALDMCRRYDWWLGGFTGYTGAAIIRVVWTVYDHLQKRVIYQTTTTGFGQEDQTSAEARETILQRAFTAAASALGKDEGFRRVGFQPSARLGGPAALAPALAPSSSSALAPSSSSTLAPPALFQPRVLELAPDVDSPLDLDAESKDPGSDPSLELAIPRQRQRVGAIGGGADALARATVVISLGESSGSGFFVARDEAGGGWILTNAHVVHHARRVRVSTFDRRARVGIVERRHGARDVALVHVEGEIPAVVSIRETSVAVGDEVYAVGEPLGKAQRNTLTHGIVSKFTRNPGSRQPVIQSDISIQHGNSGGPLSDRSGNVIGICSSGKASAVDTSIGINYFIPISDALDKLRLVLSGKA